MARWTKSATRSKAIRADTGRRSSRYHAGRLTEVPSIPVSRLEVVEKTDAAGGDRSKLLAELDAIDQASAKLHVPRPKIPDYLDFRQFLHDMRYRAGNN